jgi:hypothetical protein
MISTEISLQNCMTILADARYQSGNRPHHEAPTAESPPCKKPPQRISLRVPIDMQEERQELRLVTPNDNLLAPLTFETLLADMRVHASYFECPNTNQTSSDDLKKRKERGVVLEWLRTEFGDPDEHVRRIESFQGDPPDVIVEFKSGQRVGVEVVELVDQKSAGDHKKYRNLSMKPVEYHDYSGKDLKEELDRLVKLKHPKLQNAQAKRLNCKCQEFTETFLLIFTDERLVNTNSLSSYCEPEATCFSSIILLSNPYTPPAHDWTIRHSVTYLKGGMLKP